MNLAPKNYYKTEIWLSNIINIVKEIVEVDELNKGNISGRQPSAEVNLWWKTTYIIKSNKLVFNIAKLSPSQAQLELR